MSRPNRERSLVDHIGERDEKKNVGVVESRPPDMPPSPSASRILDAQMNFSEEVDNALQRMREHILEQHVTYSEKLTQEFIDKIHDAEASFLKHTP